MYITQIEVSQMTGPAGIGPATGFVSLQSDQSHVQMHCAVPDTTPVTRRDALIAEALRQLGRMPEFRSGARKLSFAPEVLGIMATVPAAA